LLSPVIAHGMPANTMFSAVVLSPNMSATVNVDQPGLNFAVTIFTPNGSSANIRIAATLLTRIVQGQVINLTVRWAGIAA
jgi:hypothetical protein